MDRRRFRLLRTLSLGAAMALAVMGVLGVAALWATPRAPTTPEVRAVLILTNTAVLVALLITIWWLADAQERVTAKADTTTAEPRMPLAKVIE